MEVDEEELWERMLSLQYGDAFVFTRNGIALKFRKEELNTAEKERAKRKSTGLE